MALNGGKQPVLPYNSSKYNPNTDVRCSQTQSQIILHDIVVGLTFYIPWIKNHKRVFVNTLTSKTWDYFLPYMLCGQEIYWYTNMKSCNVNWKLKV